MAAFTKADVLRILVNLDELAAPSAPDRIRAWAHIFIAAGLVQRELPSPEQLTRERFMELAGKVHDDIYKGLKSGLPS